MSEANVMRRIMKRLSVEGARVFRNNVGQAWTGSAKMIRKSGAYFCEEGDVILRRARRFHGGLEVKSSDIIGWTPVTITESMVGKTVAVFTGIEVKSDEKKAVSASKSKQAHEKGQQNFCAAIRFSGGLAGFAGSEDQAVDLIREQVSQLKT